MKSPRQSSIPTQRLGFTLIEVLFATIILVGGMLAMSSFLGNVINKNGNNENRTTATVIGQEKIEELRNSMFQTNLVAVTGTDTPVTGFTRSWSVDDTINPHTVIVTVVWDGLGDSQVRLETYLNDFNDY